MLNQLKEYFRKRFPGMTTEVAMYQKARLSIWYSLLAWNIFGLTVYVLYKVKFPDSNSSSDYAKILGIKNASVVKYSGFMKVNEYNMKLEESDFQKYYQTKIENESKDNQEIVIE